jgi:transcription elongation GreA/GreB family factor
VNKRALLDRILTRLQSELDMLTQAALATHAEATDEENKAEDKYDTRGLEASYLAIGQSKAAEEAAQAVAQFSALTVRDFKPTEPVSLGALVMLEANGRSTHYFMGPRSGGTEIEHEGHTVMVITPQSPLGRQLLGRLEGDTLQLDLGGKRTQQVVTTVR